MARKSNDDYEAMRTAIGLQMRTLLSDVLRQPLPAGMDELLEQLDHPTEGGLGVDNA
jgi:hypothetical protein